MTTRHSRSVTAALGALLLAAASADAFVINWKTGTVGVARGQSVRVNVAHVGNPNCSSMEPCIKVFDVAGNLLAESDLTLVPGQSASLDLSAAQLGGPDTKNRFPIRAEIELSIDDGRQARFCQNNLVPTLEVFDDETGEATLFVSPALVKGFNPQPDPPGATLDLLR